MIPLYKPRQTGASEVFAIYGGKIPRTPLSKERAVTVKNYLINKSIAAERLSVEGLGSNKPVADNATADGRKKNRRIEFDVI